ncbi:MULTISPECIES: hypothetical protein [unclassified Burkholderia]|uniref:hypothetical protein n=1 Tax=unclassified Burkholderia TaxID=2613784 RepID=UPI0015C5B3D0|nr:MULTISPECIES: hypothetical protein [unclassified Burkholderia]MDN7428962.1 hypothetical protein [Burkholderia sp. AU45388]
MEYEIEIDSREKKSVKKRGPFIRGQTGKCRLSRSRDERFARRGARQAARNGIFYAAARKRRSLLPLSAGIYALFRLDISGGNIPKYFQISCDYFCL